MAQTRKMVYRFDEGDARMRELLGGKGANLCEMAGLGLPVPPGFVITTETCRAYYDAGGRFPDGLWDDIKSYMTHVESSAGRGFGSSEAPLLVSVRSGAPISMPGMMDTILNLGINDQTVDGLARLMNNQRVASDAYRRFVDMYGRIVLGIDGEVFNEILDHHKAAAGATQDQDLSVDQLRSIVADFQEAVKREVGVDVPQDPWEQLEGAIDAVFSSWNGARAITYRNARGIPHDMGTAVNIMAMVFGNLGNDSGTGVLFTRNPSTGHRALFGEYLINAQGEDVVAGTRTPQDISTLSEVLPEVYTQLEGLANGLEAHYRDVQDIEFTVEAGRLYVLQTRNASRAPQAAVTTAVEMVNEGAITREEALRRIDAEDLASLFVPQFQASEKDRAVPLARGTGASPGACAGHVYFDSEAAIAASQEGISAVLVRPETNPEDIGGILASVGVLTSRGGVTSHAAVVTRGLGKACVVGCEEMRVDLKAREFVANGRTIREGDQISMDGATGEVFAGLIPTFQPDLENQKEAQVVLAWADEASRLGVLANADTPDDAVRARSMGARGIGLCRTEHMFLGDRVPLVRQAMLHAAEAERWLQQTHDDGPHASQEEPIDVREYRDALSQLHRLQTDDFVGILRAMDGLPVIIRLLDAPFHEFMPDHADLARELEALSTREMPDAEVEREIQLLKLAESVIEANPMLGHRGCRVGITFPMMYDMQVDAIMTASILVQREGLHPRPEVMIPLASHVNEMTWLRKRLLAVIERVQREAGVEVHCPFGAMIETPRAAITADQVARESDFFSFGTNDLTQMAYGFSRDDAEGKFLRFYVDTGMLPADPFVSIDLEGVGELVRIGVEKGRSTRPGMEMGICGEHGGDPRSVTFCHQVGLDYVSCSPFRVPTARLAAAQAALRD